MENPEWARTPNTPPEVNDNKKGERHFFLVSKLFASIPTARKVGDEKCTWSTVTRMRLYLDRSSAVKRQLNE